MSLADIDVHKLMIALQPNPPSEYIVTEMQKDKMRNPHNEAHKPPLRETIEIIADYKIKLGRLIVSRMKF